MEVNTTLPTSQNNTAAVAGSTILPTQKQDAEAQRVSAAKEPANTGSDVKQNFNQESIIRDAIRKNVIKGESQIFNFRVTTFENYMTFTNVITGAITTGNMRDIVGDNVIDAAV